MLRLGWMIIGRLVCLLIGFQVASVQQLTEKMTGPVDNRGAMQDKSNASPALPDLDAIPVKALADKLDARIALKAAIQQELDLRADLKVGDEISVQGVTVRITRVPRQDPLVTGRYVILSEQ
jgi:hypothetical protein